MKTIKFTNNQGRVVKIPSKATIGDMLKMGIRFAGFQEIGSPMPKDKKIYVNK